MQWTTTMVTRLLEAARETAADERDCEAIHQGLAALAEGGTPLDEALVRQHLALCAHCTEEFGALSEAIATLGADGSSR